MKILCRLSNYAKYLVYWQQVYLVQYSKEHYTCLQILDTMIMNCTILAQMGFQLVCPVKRYRNTSSDRIKLVEFYESDIGQTIYSLRSISIEPLIEHIKSVFRIDPLPVRGYAKSCATVLLSVLLYQILVYYNCKTRKDNPRAIKYMLGT